ILAANLPAEEGIRVLPAGDVVLADRQNGSVWRVEPDGTRHVVHAGYDFPDGIEVDRNGIVYMTELGTGKVHRLDPLTGDDFILLDGEIPAPDGISFNVDYTALYITDVGGVPNVWRLPMT